jgi:vacuolar protein sorting-associated protein 54
VSAAHRPPSTRDIPPVTLANIPHVEPSAFQPYLAQVGPLFDARLRAEGDESSSQWLRRDRGGAKDDEFADVLERSTSREPPRPRVASRQGSLSTLSPVDTPQPRRRSSGGIPRRQFAVTPLSTIPNVYFEENFRLENPRTFDIVSERSEVVRTPQSSIDEKGLNGSANGAPVQPRKALATNAILQEKLSWYLDTVEIHLISSISTASKSFFAALGSLKELHSEAAESVTKIKKLREDLAKLDKDMAIGGLEIVAMKQRRDNLRKLSDAVLQLRYVVEGAEHCQQLVDDGELETALESISTLEEFTCGAVDPTSDLSWLCPERPRQLLDLRRLRCLDGFAEGMEQLRSKIGKGYESRFLDALLTDLREHVKKASNQETLRRWGQASQRSRGLHAPGPSVVPTYLQTNSLLRQDLANILTGLSRSKYTSTATKTFWDASMREMKKLIQQHLPSSNEDDAESMVSISTRSSRTPSRTEKSAILARNLHALGPEDSEELFTKVYCAVGEALRRLQVQIKLLLDISSGQGAASPTSTGMRSPPRSPNIGSIDTSIQSNKSPLADNNLQEQLMQTLDMSSLLGQAVDVAQSQISKILRVRSEETLHLPLSPFLRYFTLNKLFADECEAVSGRSGVALRNIIDGQIKDWINVLAERERQELADTMEKDRWDAQDFTEKDSVLLNQVLQAMQTDPEPWLAQTHVWKNDRLQGQTNGTPSLGLAEINGTKDTKTRPAIIDEERYFLVKSAVLLLHGLSRFCILIACLPRLTPELSSAILDYLRLFTSRTNQLVLFAGATRSAGLERINTKHLALASQALGFIVVLVPYLREFVRRKAGQGAQTSGFDGVMRSTQHNQMSIHEKLVSIMAMRAQAHVKEMRKIDFDREGEAEQAALSESNPTLVNGDGGVPDGRVSRHMETLTKETNTLHRVLSRHLPEVTVRMIMGPVFDSYKEVWGEAFRDVKVKTEPGKRRCVSALYFSVQRMLISNTDFCETPNSSTPDSAKSMARAMLAPSLSILSTRSRYREIRRLQRRHLSLRRLIVLVG